MKNFLYDLKILENVLSEPDLDTGRRAKRAVRLLNDLHFWGGWAGGLVFGVVFHDQPLTLALAWVLSLAAIQIYYNLKGE